MENIKSYGILKKNHYYLHDNFDKSMEEEFRKLKGRFYKKNKYWIFPAKTILLSEKDMNPIESSPIESSPEESSPIESSPEESSPVESSPVEKYKYNPPPEIYYLIHDYISSF